MYFRDEEWKQKVRGFSSSMDWIEPLFNIWYEQGILQSAVVKPTRIIGEAVEEEVQMVTS
jgi:hypothetical protein